MFRTRSLVFLLLVAVPLTACGLMPVSITGSGNLVTQDKTMTGFDKVDVRQGFKVVARQGNIFRVIIHLDDNIVEHLEIAKTGDTLSIGLKRHRSYSLTDATLEAEVTMPTLVGLDLSSASQVTITGFKSTGDFHADLSSDSQLQGDIETGNVNFDLSSDSELALSGSAQDMKLDASSGSRANLIDFYVANADIEASSDSTVRVRASGRLDVNASSDAQVYYLGDPVLGDIDASSGATIQRE